MALGTWTRLEALVFGTAIGGAFTRALEAVLEPVRQHAWEQNKVRVLDVRSLAELVATGALAESDVVGEAGKTGYNENRLKALIYLSQTAPPYAEVLDLWRRDKFGPFDPNAVPAQVTHALAKAGIEEQYWTPITELFYERLSLQQIALGVVRSLLNSQGLQTGENPTTGGRVPGYPVSDIDIIAEARSQGFDTERLRVAIGEIGLPPSVQQAASMLFRDIIDQPDYYLAIAQGDARPAWADYWLEQARQILTANEYAERQLRGYTDRAGRLADTAKHGMSDEDSDKLYEVLGRGLSLRQAFIGKRRGGELNGPIDQIPEWALYQLQRGNLRPEVFNLAWAARESYPSAFVFRQLLTDGVLTQDQGYHYLLKLGWPDELATLTAQTYAAKTTGGADKHVAKAQTQLWTATHKSYIADEISDAIADNALTAAGVDATAIRPVLDIWGVERALVRKQLTAAQVKKALREAVVNRETGLPWTRDDAIAALLLQGYDPNAANEFLDI